MATKNPFYHQTYFYSLNKVFVDEFLSHNMLPLASFLRFFLSNFVFSMFGLIIRKFFRIQAYYGTRSMVVDSALAIEDHESEKIMPISRSTQKIEFVEEKADYKTTRKPEPEPEPETTSVLASNPSKHQLEPTTQIHEFMEESETANCIVEEMYCGSPSPGNQTSGDLGFSSAKYLQELEELIEMFGAREVFEKEDDVLEKGDRVESKEVGCLSDNVEDNFGISEDEEYIEIELESHLYVSYAKVLPVNGDSLRDLKETKWDDKGMKFEEEEGEEEEFLQEHQDLIKQLKRELRNSRTGGLPTVLEEEEEEEAEPESISPKLVQALAPLKNCGKFEYKEHFREIQKVYKTYAQKMRKLDVSNTQTMYAIGLVKLKDPITPIVGRKSGVKALLSHKLWSGRTEKGCPKLMRDFKRDLEVVYVGHLCLSWEVLHWQHRKAIELQQNESGGTSQYSRVVNEFQLFCILIERFVEDEQFRGPRIENYAENRLLIHSLLQVPGIREDCVNDKRLRGGEGESTVSTAALVSIIEDSMWVFREFLRTDNVGNSTIKCARVQKLHHTQSHLRNPCDAAQLMMMEIRSGLRKKEKRLKDIMRSGNCMVKKFQRITEEGRLKNELLIAEVELKLVARVLSMPRLTESQLIWCHKKLYQVNFVNRKVVIEPSFLLFPC